MGFRLLETIFISLPLDSLPVLLARLPPFTATRLPGLDRLPCASHHTAELPPWRAGRAVGPAARRVGVEYKGPPVIQLFPQVPKIVSNALPIILFSCAVSQSYF